MGFLSLFRFRKKKNNKNTSFEKHVEYDTECDLCEYLDSCGEIMEITRLRDSRRHYICVPFGDCKKCRRLWQKKLRRRNIKSYGLRSNGTAD